MEENADIYKIPAFQRRASINARAKKVASQPERAVVIPNARVQPFPQVIDRRPAHMRETVSGRPIFGQTLARKAESANQDFLRPTMEEESLSARNRRINRDRDVPGESQLYTRNPESKTLFQRVRTRMEKDSYYNDATYDEEFFDAMNSSVREMECVGIVTMYFDKIQVAVIDLIKTMKLGDRLVFEQDDNRLFEQVIDSMQHDKRDIKAARSGQEIGIKLELQPKLGGKVWKVL